MPLPINDCNSSTTQKNAYYNDPMSNALESKSSAHEEINLDTHVLKPNNKILFTAKHYFFNSYITRNVNLIIIKSDNISVYSQYYFLKNNECIISVLIHKNANKTMLSYNVEMLHNNNNKTASDDRTKWKTLFDHCLYEYNAEIHKYQAKVKKNK